MAKSPPPPICILRGHEGYVTAFFFTDEEGDGITVKPSLISGSETGEIFIWDVKTCRSYHRFKCHDGKMILYVSYYKSSLLSHGRDGVVNVWRFMANQWTVSRSLNSTNYGFCTSQFFFTEYRSYLIIPTGDGPSLTFYDYETGDILHNYQCKTTIKMNNLETSETCMCIKVFEKNSQLFLLLGFDSGYIILWDYESKTEKSKLKCHQDSLLCLDYDDKFRNRGISGSVDNLLKIWQVNEDNQLIKIHEVKITNPGINAIKIREDGKIVVTAGQDTFVRVFSWKNMRPLAVLQFHTKPVVALQFYKELFGNYATVFASGSKDKNICLWSIY